MAELVAAVEVVHSYFLSGSQTLQRDVAMDGRDESILQQSGVACRQFKGTSHAVIF
jgi:hypothetical protein